VSSFSKPVVTAVDVGGAGGGPVDPTIEITQPGGPFPFGHGILADGAGGYLLAPTLRPYFLGFSLPAQVGVGGTVACEHQGVDTSISGVVVPFACSLIGISVAVDEAVQPAHSYAIEIVSDPTSTPTVLGTLLLNTTDERTDFRRDLSVAISAGLEIGARFIQTAGDSSSAFTTGIVNIELEA